ncbi:MAG: hypothetical protein M1275_00780 [Patescibacteria group bacterium]|nr:hypothetical protein [Patescibacteria group bacterium]
MPEQTTATPAVKHHTNWLCHDCCECGVIATKNQADLANAIKSAHTAASPDCPSKYIATLPHVHPH